MLETLRKLQDKIDSRILRERVLILLTLIAFIFMAWSLIVQSRFDKRIKEAHAQSDALTQQNTAVKTQIAAATQMLANDPNKPKKAQIEQLQSDIKNLDDNLQQASQNLIKADLLPQALQDVLQKTSQVTLLEVNTLPVEELQLGQSENKDAKKVEVSAGVYKHVVELKVKGSYSQVLELLVSLEKLQWKFYWQSLEYNVDHYPVAEIKLRVFTLSSEEGLFGV